MKWKCIKENKPENNKEYLVFDGDICIADFEDPFWFKNGSILLQDVSYYMDLPQQPERLNEKTPKGDAIV